MTNIKAPAKRELNPDEALAYAVEISFNELLSTVNRHNFNLLPIPFEELDGNLKSEFADVCAKVLAAVPAMQPDGPKQWDDNPHNFPIPGADSTGTP